MLYQNYLHPDGETGNAASSGQGTPQPAPAPSPTPPAAPPPPQGAAEPASVPQEYDFGDFKVNPSDPTSMKRLQEAFSKHKTSNSRLDADNKRALAELERYRNAPPPLNAGEIVEQTVRKLLAEARKQQEEAETLQGMTPEQRSSHEWQKRMDSLEKRNAETEKKLAEMIELNNPAQVNAREQDRIMRAEVKAIVNDPANAWMREKTRLAGALIDKAYQLAISSWNCQPGEHDPLRQIINDLMDEGDGVYEPRVKSRLEKLRDQADKNAAGVVPGGGAAGVINSPKKMKFGEPGYDEWKTQQMLDKLEGHSSG